MAKLGGYVFDVGENKTLQNLVARQRATGTTRTGSTGKNKKRDFGLDPSFYKDLGFETDVDGSDEFFNMLVEFEQFDKENWGRGIDIQDPGVDPEALTQSRVGSKMLEQIFISANQLKTGHEAQKLLATEAMKKGVEGKINTDPSRQPTDFTDIPGQLKNYSEFNDNLNTFTNEVNESQKMHEESGAHEAAQEERATAIEYLETKKEEADEYEKDALDRAIAVIKKSSLGTLKREELERKISKDKQDRAAANQRHREGIAAADARFEKKGGKQPMDAAWWGEVYQNLRGGVQGEEGYSDHLARWGVEGVSDIIQGRVVGQNETTGMVYYEGEGVLPEVEIIGPSIVPGQREVVRREPLTKHLVKKIFRGAYGSGDKQNIMFQLFEDYLGGGTGIGGAGDYESTGEYNYSSQSKSEGKSAEKKEKKKEPELSDKADVLD